jgi:hypothetical protein
VVGGDLDGGDLELEQLVPELPRDTELDKALPCRVRQVVGDLEINVVRRRCGFAGPALLDDLQQFLRDVDAPPVVPAILEPLGELLAGVLIDDVDV